MGHKAIFNKKLIKWKWRLLVLFFSVVLLSMAAYGLFDSTDAVQRGGLTGRLGVSASLPLLANMALPGGLSARHLIGGVSAGIGMVSFFWATALSRSHWNGIAIVPRLLKVISQPITDHLRRWAAAKAEVRKLEPKPKQKRPVKKSNKKTKKEPVLMQANQPDAVAEKTIATTAGTVKKLQSSFDFEVHDTFKLPPLKLLKTPSKTKASATQSVLDQNAEHLKPVLSDFRIQGEIDDVRDGPVVTRYGLRPAPGTKSQRVIALADDIARSMSALAVRVAVVPGENVIGIELPNQDRETVLLRHIFDHPEWLADQGNLPLALGKDIAGAPIIADLARMPHLLVAGTTGSGKSVGINGMILSLLYRYTPDECRLIMIDPKMLELSAMMGSHIC